jgi:hypothetical protein
MVYFGRVHNGKIVTERDVTLPEGSRVRIEPLELGAQQPSEPDPLYTIGDDAADVGVSDMSQEHDHHVYGTPKRNTRKE